MAVEEAYGNLGTTIETERSKMEVSKILNKIVESGVSPDRMIMTVESVDGLRPSLIHIRVPLGSKEPFDRNTYPQLMIIQNCTLGASKNAGLDAEAITFRYNKTPDPFLEGPDQDIVTTMQRVKYRANSTAETVLINGRDVSEKITKVSDIDTAYEAFQAMVSEVISEATSAEKVN